MSAAVAPKKKAAPKKEKSPTKVSPKKKAPAKKASPKTKTSSGAKGKAAKQQAVSTAPDSRGRLKGELTIDEYAAKHNCSPDSVRLWIRSGKLKSRQYLKPGGKRPVHYIDAAAPRPAGFARTKT